MTEYAVTGYLVTPMTVWIEADSAEEALELGEDKLREGEGYEGDSDWNDEFDSYELVEKVEA